MKIYKISNSVNDKLYIGQTIRPLNVRFNRHCTGSDNMPIVRAIKKYGKDKFKIELICECDSIDDMNIKEEYYIDHYKSLVPSGYNIKLGGNNFTMSEETKYKISNALKGKPKSLDHIEKVKASNLANDPNYYKNLHKLNKYETYDSKSRKNLSKSKNSKSIYVGVTIDSKSYSYRSEFYFQKTKICKSFNCELAAAHYYDYNCIKNGIDPINFPDDIWDELKFEKFRSKIKVRVSFYYGVRKTQSGKWLGSIWYDKKPNYLGTFPTEIEAAQAVDNFLKNNNLPLRNFPIPA